MCRDAQFDSSTTHFPHLSSSIFMTLRRNYQSGINVSRIAYVTEIYPECNHMEPYVKHKDGKQIDYTRIIIVMNWFSLLKR